MTAAHLWPAWGEGVCPTLRPFIKHFLWPAPFQALVSSPGGKSSQTWSPSAQGSWSLDCEWSFLHPVLPGSVPPSFLYPRRQLPFILGCPAHFLFSMISDIHWGKRDGAFQRPDFASRTLACPGPSTAQLSSHCPAPAGMPPPPAPHQPCLFTQAGNDLSCLSDPRAICLYLMLTLTPHLLQLLESPAIFPGVGGGAGIALWARAMSNSSLTSPGISLIKSFCWWPLAILSPGVALMVYLCNIFWSPILLHAHALALNHPTSAIVLLIKVQPLIHLNNHKVIYIFVSSRMTLGVVLEWICLLTTGMKHCLGISGTSSQRRGVRGRAGDPGNFSGRQSAA